MLEVDLRLPIAEALLGSGAPVLEALTAWERVRQPAELVAARRFELVARLQHGQASQLLRRDPSRASSALLKARAASDSAEPQQPVLRAVSADRIGVLLPMSGRLVTVGGRLLNGLRLGLSGSTTLVLRDSSAGAAAMPGLVSQLVAEGVVAIVGPVDRLAARAASEAAAKHQVPLLRLSVADKEHEVSDWAFRAFVSRRSQCRAEIARARKLGARRFAIARPDTPYGAAVAAAFAAEVKAAGGRVSVTAVYPAGSPTLQANARQFRDKRFGALFIADNKIARAGLLLRFLAREDIWSKRPGVKAPPPESKIRYVHVFGPAEWHSGQVPSEALRYLRGSVVAVEWPGAADPAVHKFVASTKAAFDVAPGVFEAVGYDAIQVLKASRGTTRSKMAEALRTLTFDGVLGRLKFDPTGEPARRARLYRVGKTSFQPTGDRPTRK